jgi:purine-binding chemotaxis protein CheW
MQPTLARAPEPAPSSKVQETLVVVTFRISDQTYALPVDVVEEVVSLPALLQLPGAPDTLAGILNRRGQYIAVLDGRALAGKPPHHTLASQVLLVGRGRAEIGVIVDQVCAVHMTVQVHQAPVDGYAAPWLHSVIDTSDGAVVLLHLESLFALVPGKAIQERP